MKFLSIYKTVERTVPPSQEEMDRMNKLVEEGMKAGWVLAVEGCLPSALGARVRKSNGKTTVTDGPFAETKELVGGLAILQANSKEHAIEMAKVFPRLCRGWRVRASPAVRGRRREPMWPNAGRGKGMRFFVAQAPAAAGLCGF